MTTNDGGPAFPAERMEGLHNLLTDSTDFQRVQYPGMSLRDWFAGQAFSQAVEDYGQPDLMKSSGQRRDRGNPILPYANQLMTREEIVAGQAYRYADAMLAARKGGPDEE